MADQAAVRRRRPPVQRTGALRAHRHRHPRRGPARGRALRGELSPKDATLFQALGHAVLQDRELTQALREALVDPEIAALEEILRRGVERGEVDADNPALEYVPAQIFGVLRARPVLEGRNADPDYVLRFVEAAVLPALGLR